jgi:hypothetical protein
MAIKPEDEEPLDKRNQKKEASVIRQRKDLQLV